ncbi:STAS domain-containing protein [Streptomyces sp. NPDC051133]|uniref:STAS domain-containing protein n=1 Tax=Streptomyces sp. NPDC051133 TaxID=3155521 RepID=UPI0034470233
MAEGRRADAESAEHAPLQGRLSVVASATDGIRVLTVAGEVDHDTGGRLRQALEVPETGCPRIVVDLRQVTFMDSSGINILLIAHRDVLGAGGWLRLAAPDETVLRTLQIVGVDEVIPCRPTLSDALRP